MQRIAVIAIVTTGLFTSIVAMASTPEQRCQAGRYHAAAKYAQCELNRSKRFASGPAGPGLTAINKCRIKYTSTWINLSASASGTGSSCDAPRFVVGSGIVRDSLTGLEWEQKTDDSTVHDKDNTYTWGSGGINDPTSDGPVFTTFLSTLNTAPCFADRCDWRVPTVAELETILAGPLPCSTSPCIDPVFGPTVPAGYMTSTFLPGLYRPFEVYFYNGAVYAFGQGTYVRAVRGGL